MLDVVPAEGDALFGGCGGVWGIAVAGMARSYRGIVYLYEGVSG